MTQINNSTLKDEAKSNDHNAVQKLLAENKDLDLTWAEGAALQWAIKHACDIKQTEKYTSDALEILQALLGYYKAQNLSGDSKSESYENALYKLCDILVDAHKSYPFTYIVKDIVVKYFKCLVSADITDDMKEIINWIDEDDGEQSERDDNFDDETYGSLDTLDSINTDDYVPQDNELPPSADTEWSEHLLHFRHPIGYTPDQITEHL